MHSRSYNYIFTAVTRADTAMLAPGAHAESFDPLLKSLQKEVQPILSMHFGTTDLAQIVGDMDKQAPTPTPAAAQQQRPSIAELADRALDGIMGPPAGRPHSTVTDAETNSKRFSGMDQMNARREQRQKSAHWLNTILPDPDPKLTTSFQRADYGYTQYQRQKEHGPVLRLSPSIGKTEVVGGSVDVTRAFQRMESNVRQNRVKIDTQRQRFHVRRGQLKKNLRIERWRKLFKEGFIAECARVRKMRKQGW
ncbi:uncharacterized protein HMPREF1541_01385 [Cyphellophora europaea CBS 101466]|uniref:Ribosomal protein S21 n=1 Tax=Cyphellophora europaea (strain CBS 101466) TaxID=1220924 RepID=W2SH50_CYPE1|nr:uncharacterized protein HMPREF1541_01385 [Cyphellophora europaea CBS 101466]ETN47194.1 hypothetical protein HMPREF1541_01385 [Cyphellophora europaea CBS 101466]